MMMLGMSYNLNLKDPVISAFYRSLCIPLQYRLEYSTSDSFICVEYNKESDNYVCYYCDFYDRDRSGHKVTHVILLLD